MFRENVAALIKYQNKYIACCRADHSSWQNVQGGIEESDQSPLHAIIRETKEELGLNENDFKVVYKSMYWRRYFFPKEILKRDRFKKNIGQEQLWFLIELIDINAINLAKSSGEFKKVDLISIEQFISLYATWKRPAFYDFCRELNLI